MPEFRPEGLDFWPLDERPEGNRKTRVCTQENALPSFVGPAPSDYGTRSPATFCPAAPGGRAPDEPLRYRRLSGRIPALPRASRCSDLLYDGPTGVPGVSEFNLQHLDRPMERLLMS